MGNLLIAAMNAIDDGDFEEAIRHMNRVLAVRGRVVPASGTPLTLHARLRDGGLIEGQSRIARMRAIESVWLEPADVRASRDALAAIAEADLVVLGPGSLYTSVLPPLLVPEIRAALATTPALRVFACNVATQAGRPRATTWPTMSRRSSPTWGRSPWTSCSRTTTSPAARPTLSSACP